MRGPAFAAPATFTDPRLIPWGFFENAIYAIRYTLRDIGYMMCDIRYAINDVYYAIFFLSLLAISHYLAQGVAG